MSNVIVWSKENCPSCSKAMSLLDKLNISYETRKIGEGWTKEQLLEEVPTARSVPQIIINGQTIGGYENLTTYIEETGFNGTGHSIGDV
jgi:glutaredoxin 3